MIVHINGTRFFIHFVVPLIASVIYLSRKLFLHFDISCDLRFCFVFALERSANWTKVIWMATHLTLRMTNTWNNLWWYRMCLIHFKQTVWLCGLVRDCGISVTVSIKFTKANDTVSRGCRFFSCVDFVGFVGLKRKSGENKLFWRQQHWPTSYTWRSLFFYTYIYFWCMFKCLTLFLCFVCLQILLSYSNFLFLFALNFLLLVLFFFVSNEKRHKIWSVYFRLETLIVYIAQNAYDLFRLKEHWNARAQRQEC